VRHAWPAIHALLNAGHSLKDVHVWLAEIGIEIGYARLSDYTSKLKRGQKTDGDPIGAHEKGRPCTLPTERAASWPVASAVAEPEHLERKDDPLANMRDRERRPPGFRFNAEPDPKKLI
jgi:hypothetical protein